MRVLALPSVTKGRSPDQAPDRRRKPYPHPDLMGPSISFACPALTLEARSYRGGHSAFVALDPDDRDQIIAIVR